MGLLRTLDPRDLSQTGWGIIFAQDADPAIKVALGELLDRRQAQAGDRFRLYDGSKGFRPKETRARFLARNGVSAGTLDPNRVPYYLLIVGSLEEIPIHFQVQLDVDYAVGRLHFDTLEEYAQYARSVVLAETGKTRLPRRAAFFGVQHPDDPYTQMTTNLFVRPLIDSVTHRYSEQMLDVLVGVEATKARLMNLLHWSREIGLLVTAGHALVFPADHPRRRTHQGALLCADWPGPRQWRQPIPPDFYFSTDDIVPSMHLHGMISLHYSSFSAGTPGADYFSQMRSQRTLSSGEPSSLPFVAPLAQRLLAHPQGGALAVIGLSDQARSYTFASREAEQIQSFGFLVKQLLDGYPVGYALEYVNERYAELATQLSKELEEIQFGKNSEPATLAALWTANHDARNFMIVGDPAVRLPSSR